MIIRIDRIDQWTHAGSSPVEGVMRHYYLAAAPHRALLVVRGDLRLSDLLHRHVDVALGWDDGTTPGFARVPDEEQTKITVFCTMPPPAVGQARTLSSVLADAPRNHEMTIPASVPWQ